MLDRPILHFEISVVGRKTKFDKLDLKGLLKKIHTVFAEKGPFVFSPSDRNRYQLTLQDLQIGSKWATFLFNCLDLDAPAATYQNDNALRTPRKHSDESRSISSHFLVKFEDGCVSLQARLEKRDGGITRAQITRFLNHLGKKYLRFSLELENQEIVKDIPKFIIDAESSEFLKNAINKGRLLSLELINKSTIEEDEEYEGFEVKDTRILEFKPEIKPNFSMIKSLIKGGRTEFTEYKIRFEDEDSTRHTYKDSVFNSIEEAMFCFRSNISVSQKKDAFSSIDNNINMKIQKTFV